MSMLTKALGLDPVIAAARKEDWEETKAQLVIFLAKYIGREKALLFAMALNLADSHSKKVMDILD